MTLIGIKINFKFEEFLIFKYSCDIFNMITCISLS